MTLSLDDIARLAGVSRATASRVMNDHPDVSLATRQKVQEVMVAHNYRPNPAARMLATQRTRIIGIAVRNPSQTFRSDYGPILFEGISAIANERDYATLLYWEQSEPDKERFSQRILQQNRLMDGMLMASTEIDSPLIDQLLELQIPFVMMERPTRYADEISYVTIDNIQSTQIAVEHLIALGRKHIAHIAGLSSSIDALDRLTSYRDTLQQHGISFDPRWVVEGSWSRERGYNAMKELLARDIPIDAVFASNDDGAEGVLVALREAGIRVPDDISVVGFDDVPNAQHASPQLTTVHQPIQEKGAQATALLLDILEGVVSEPQHIILPTQLIIRQSCGAQSKAR